jgi:hypothetical protein
MPDPRQAVNYRYFSSKPNLLWERMKWMGRGQGRYLSRGRNFNGQIEKIGAAKKSNLSYGTIPLNTYACSITKIPTSAVSARLCQKTERRMVPASGLSGWPPVATLATTML